MKLVLAIALGGAIGAVGRHYLSVAMTLLLGHGFPWGTLVVNILGSFLLGVLIEAMALAWSPTAEMRALLTVGVLGAFTTFSTFSLDVATLYERGASLLLAFYIVTSVAVSILALFAGLRLMRSWAGINPMVDLLSVLGEVDSLPGVFVAVPGDAGYTLGPYCARLLVDSMSGSSSDYSLADFSPTRFSANDPVAPAASG